MPFAFDLRAYISQLKVSKKTTESAYTSSPTGEISIARLIENKADYFKKTAPNTREVKKNIILSDWTSRGYDENQNKIEEELVTQLLQQGFNVYIWQIDHLERLGDAKQLMLLRRNITPIIKDELLKKSVQELKKPIDELHVLDSQEMRHIFFPGNPMKQKMISGDCLKSIIDDSPSWIPLIKQYLNHYPPQGFYSNICIISDQKPYAPSITPLIFEHFEELKSLPIDESPYLLEITANNILTKNLCTHQKDYNAFDKLCADFGPTNISEQLISYKQFHLEFDEFNFSDFDSSTSPEELKKVLYQQFLQFIQQLPNLKEVLFDAAPLPELMELNFPHHIKNLLLYANRGSLRIGDSQLQSIEIYRRTRSSHNIEFTADNPHLNHLFLKNCQFDIQNLQKTLNLQELELWDVNILGSISPSTRLDHLQSLKLSCEYNESAFQLLKSAHHLKELELCIKINPSFIIRQTPQFPELEKCSLDNMKDEQSVLLLQHSPNLQSLKIGISSDYYIDKIDISNLKEFTLNEKKSMSINCNLSPFLSKGQKLEKLSLDLNQIRISEPVSLATLKSLSIGKYYAPGQSVFNSFENLINQAPLLEELTINHYDVCVNGTLTNSFAHLKKLHLKSTNIDTNILQQIIEPSEKIEKLSIEHRFYQCGNYLFQQSFPNLKTLQFDTDQLDPDFLGVELFKNFLKRHPHIQSITISAQSQLIDESLLSLLRHYNKVLINYFSIDRYIEKQQIKSKENIAYSTANSASPSENSSRAKLYTPDVKRTSSIDADTKLDPNTKFDAQEIFTPLDGASNPPVNHYRLETYDTLAFGKTSEPFLLNNSQNMHWDPSNNPVQSTDNVIAYLPQNRQGYIYGAKTLHLNTEWQALPSLFPDEKLTHFHLTPHVDHIQIQYSKRDNLYYIKSESPQTVDIDFLIHRPPQPYNALPQNIQKHIHDFNQFGEKALQNPPSHPKELLQAIINQKVGACRHRAVAFKHLMDKEGIPCRIIENVCHVFAEVQCHGLWHSCQLGGYRAQLNVTSAPTPPKVDASSTPTHLEPSTIQEKAGASFIPQKPTVRTVTMDYAPTQELHYRTLFKPDKTAQPESLKAFIQGTLQGKQLIHVDNDNIQTLAMAIQQQAIHTHHPVFYIDSPNDLICSARVFKRQPNQKGQWQQPGGVLYDFIQAHRDAVPVFIINYAKFSADDIARISNSLYDQTASADGVPLPPQSIIVGLSDPETGYTGADFYSRFDKINDYPSTFPIPSLKPFAEQAPADCTDINLFNASSWKIKLFGGWKIQQSVPHFVPGALEEALKTGKPLKFINPPLDDPEFDKIWTQARIIGEIKTLDCTFTIPKDLPLYTEQQPFNRDVLVIASTPLANPYILNPSLAANFLQQYTFSNQTLSQTPGILELHQGQTINIELTRDLSNETWNAFFVACQQFNVTPVISQTTEMLDTWPTHNACIATPDIDFTLSQMPDSWIVIDASELKTSDLIQAIKGGIQADDFVFEQKEQALVKLLNNNQKVILKGTLSLELQDELIPFIRQHQHPGQLLIISKHPVPGLPAYTHQFTQESDLSFIKHKTLQERGEETFKGLDKIIPNIKLPNFNPNTSAQDTQAFIDERKHLVMESLKDQPYVFIAGLTGVGKSRFIESELAQDHHVFFGNIKEWATSTPNEKLNILFIDEANLSPRQWSEFEGLFQKKPGMVIDGEYVELSPNHKVIFAGNPLSYSDDRQLAPLFERHGNAIIFEPLSPAFIYEKVIKDILGDHKELGALLLDYYKFVTECSQKEVLITPRQVQMMATLVSNNSDVDPHYYAQQICRPLVPEKKLNAFDERFTPVLIKHPPIPQSTFYNTPSRLPYQHQIIDFLKLQQCVPNPGLNRMVLEGEAGIGKTEMIIDALVTQGYKKNKSFYHIPASMNYTQKKEIFLKAFDEGAIVLIDEINSVATMEKLLNSILDNKHPDDNRPPLKPGFRLIGTQNPAYYAGRNVDSPALASRTITIKLEPYPHDEMVDILQSKGLSSKKAEPLVSAFEYMQNEAIHNHEKTIPSFRDLVKKAEFIMKSERAYQKLEEVLKVLHQNGMILFNPQGSLNQVLDSMRLHDVTKAIRFDHHFFSKNIGINPFIIRVFERLFEINADLRIMPSVSDIVILNAILNSSTLLDLKESLQPLDAYLQALIKRIDNHEISFFDLQIFTAKYAERLFLIDYTVDRNHNIRFYPNNDGVTPNLQIFKALSQYFQIELIEPLSKAGLILFIDNINSAFTNLIHSTNPQDLKKIQTACDIVSKKTSNFFKTTVTSPKSTHVVFEVTHQTPLSEKYKMIDAPIQYRMQDHDGIIHAQLYDDNLPQSPMNMASIVMNMIENVLCHKTDIEILSQDAFMLGIAKSYLDFINEKIPELHLHYAIPKVTSDEGEVFFKTRIAPHLDFKDSPPWLVEALSKADQRNESARLRK